MFATVFVIGCERSPTSTDKVSSPGFSIVPGSGTWTTQASMPTGTAGAAFGVIGAKLYLAGGQIANNCAPVQTLEVYDPAANSWTTGTPMPTARWQSAAGVVNGILYVMGGEGGGCPGPIFQTVEAYDPVANTWATKAAMPTARRNFGVAAINGILYAVGGTYGGPELQTVEAYDPVANTWATKAAMPTARNILTVAVVDGILYAIGGNNYAVGGLLTTVEAYDPVANTWTTRAPMPTARAGTVSEVVQGMIYVAGGISNTGYLNTLESYDPAANVWTTLTPMPTARAFPMSGVVNNAIYVVGGAIPGDIFLATNEAFTPPYNFTGFVAPVDNPPVVNVAKAGSAIPVKFSLHGNQGLNVLAAGSPSSRTILCDNGAPQDDVTGTVTAGGSSLSYDPAADLYTYVWKTDKTWAGSCRELTVTLNDNSVHKASFKFTK